MPLRALPVWAAGPTSPDRPSRSTWASRRERRHRSRHSRRESSASMPGVDPAVSCVPFQPFMRALFYRLRAVSAPFGSRYDGRRKSRQRRRKHGSTRKPPSRPIPRAFGARRRRIVRRLRSLAPSDLRPIGRIVSQPAREDRRTVRAGRRNRYHRPDRPGASGNLALEAVAKAPADGYTLLVGNVSTNAINENTFASVLQIKPSRDLVGIAKLVE